MVNNMKRENLFIAVLESHSSDLTPFYVQFLAEYLVAMGIKHEMNIISDTIP